ncbi:MAG: hypothetical protein ACD_12C00203G0002 [uncultured bacterium]|nr:MAG: hypothetical protein ACD_12C00203G0002 [uncultured bacterium]
MKFSMTCSCGQVMEAEGATREEAMAKLIQAMTENDMAMTKEHMKMYHKPEEPIPTAEMVTQMVNQGLQPVAV